MSGNTVKSESSSDTYCYGNDHSGLLIVSMANPAEKSTPTVAFNSYTLTEYPYIKYTKKKKYCWVVGLGEIIIASAVFYTTLMLLLGEPSELKPVKLQVGRGTTFKFGNKNNIKDGVEVPVDAPRQDRLLITMLGVVIFALTAVQFLLGAFLLRGLFRSNPEETMAHCQMWLWGSYFQILYVGILGIASFCPGLEDIWSFALIVISFRILAYFIVYRFVSDIRKYFEERQMVMDIESQIRMQTGQDPKLFASRLIGNEPRLQRPVGVDQGKPKRSPAGGGGIGFMPWIHMR